MVSPSPTPLWGFGKHCLLGPHKIFSDNYNPHFTDKRVKGTEQKEGSGNWGLSNHTPTSVYLVFRNTGFFSQASSSPE